MMPAPQRHRDGLGFQTWVVVGLLAALCVSVVIVLLVPEDPGAHGFTHGRFKVMDQGGDGATRHSAIFIPGWIMGSLIIALFVSLLAWGTRHDPPGAQIGSTAREQRSKSDSRIWALLLCGLIYEGVFGMMCLTYSRSLGNPESTFLGPFPASLSWMVFGLWLIPLLFIMLYVVFYHRWIFSPESALKFKRLVTRRSKCDGDSDSLVPVPESQK